MATRDKLLAAVAGRHHVGGRTEKIRILDEFAAVTGYHRNHAARLLCAGWSKAAPSSRSERRLYDEAVGEALVVLSDASDHICGKRLKALIPTLVAAMERHGHLVLAPRVRAALLAISAATINRPWRRSGTSGGRRGPPALRRSIPVQAGTIRRPASSRSALWPIPARRRPISSCERSFLPISPQAGRNARRVGT